MPTRKASIKETGEELSPAEWERFDAAVAEAKGERNEEISADATEQRPHEADRDAHPVGSDRPREETT